MALPGPHAVQTKSRTMRIAHTLVLAPHCACVVQMGASAAVIVGCLAATVVAQSQFPVSQAISIISSHFPAAGCKQLKAAHTTAVIVHRRAAMSILLSFRVHIELRGHCCFTPNPSRSSLHAQTKSHHNPLLPFSSPSSTHPCAYPALPSIEHEAEDRRGI